MGSCTHRSNAYRLGASINPVDNVRAISSAWKYTQISYQRPLLAQSIMRRTDECQAAIGQNNLQLRDVVRGGSINGGV
jgi:hypothetical protein